MTFADYAREAARTAHAPRLDESQRLLVQALGLCGEAGEVADLIKKDAWHGKALSNERLADELGDVLWYLADLALARGIALEDVAAGNVAKLRARYPEGFVVGGGAR